MRLIEVNECVVTTRRVYFQRYSPWLVFMTFGFFNSNPNY